jgi:hypothetical protein
VRRLESPKRGGQVLKIPKIKREYDFFFKKKKISRATTSHFQLLLCITIHILKQQYVNVFKISVELCEIDSGDKFWTAAVKCEVCVKRSLLTFICFFLRKMCLNVVVLILPSNVSSFVW